MLKLSCCPTEGRRRYLPDESGRLRAAADLRRSGGQRLADGMVVRLTHNKWEDGTPTWVRLPQ